MEQIHFRAEFPIEEGKIEEYKKLVQDMSRLVEANEPDTINYQFYFNKDETKCIVNETYTNSEAVLAHFTGIASQTILPKIFKVSRISRFDVYGNPSKELQKVLAGFGPQTYNLFVGFRLTCADRALSIVKYLQARNTDIYTITNHRIHTSHILFIANAAFPQYHESCPKNTAFKLLAADLIQAVLGLGLAAFVRVVVFLHVQVLALRR